MGSRTPAAEAQVRPVYITQFTAHLYGFGRAGDHKTRRRFLDFVRAHGVPRRRDGQTVFVKASDMDATIDQLGGQLEVNATGAASLLDALGLEVAE